MYFQVDEKNKFKNESQFIVCFFFKIVVLLVKQVMIEGGIFNELEDIYFDQGLILGKVEDCLYVKMIEGDYVIDIFIKQFSNGIWFIDIDGMKSIVKIVCISGNKIIVY